MKKGGIIAFGGNTNFSEVFIRPQVSISGLTSSVGLVNTNGSLLLLNTYINATLISITGACYGVASNPLLVSFN
jgi:hypothetical protein